jgi:hypothetical protein
MEIYFNTPDLKMFLSEFKQTREERTIKITTHTSLMGGSYLIPTEKYNELFQLLSLSYSINKKYFLSEVINNTSKFKFFLDLESKANNYEITRETIEIITSHLNQVCRDMIKNFKNFDNPLIFYNDKHRTTRLHLIYNGYYLSKDLYRRILNNLKISLIDEDIRNIIDSGVNGLRMLGSYKRFESDEFGEIDWETFNNKGVYVPKENYGNSSYCFSYVKDDRRTLNKTYTKDYITPDNIKLSSILYIDGCEELIENYITPSSNILDDESFDYSSKYQLPPLYFKEKIESFVMSLGKYRAEITNYWRSVCYIIHSLSNGEEWGYRLYLKFSNIEKYTNIDEQERIKYWDSIDSSLTRLQSFNILVGFVKKDTGKLPDDLETRDNKPLERDILNKIIEEEWDISNNEKNFYIGQGEYVDKNIYTSREKCILVRANLGRGKSKSVKDWILSEDCPYKSFLLVSPRVSYSQTFLNDSDFNEKSGILYYKNSKGIIKDDRVICQYESLFRIDEFSSFDIIVIDEIESVWSQMMSRETNKENYDTNYNRFMTLMKCAKKVILSDAFLSMRTIQFVKSSGWDYRIYSWDTPRQERKTILYENEFKLLDVMIDKINKGEKCYTFCSSKNRMYNIYIPYLQRHINNFEDKFFVYSSNNKNGVDCNQWNSKLGILTTSSITVGISCDDIVFENVFSFLRVSSGVLIRDAFQSLYRVRHISGKCHFYINDRHNNFNKFKVQIAPVILERVERSLIKSQRLKQSLLYDSKLDTRLINTSPTSHLFKILKYCIAERNINNKFYREYIFHYMKRAGYTLEEKNDDEVEIPTIDIPKNKLINYFGIRNIKLFEFQSLMRNKNKTDRQKYQMMKYIWKSSIYMFKLQEDYNFKQHGMKTFKETINQIFTEYCSSTTGLKMSIDNIRNLLTPDIEWYIIQKEKTSFLCQWGNGLIKHRLLHMINKIIPLKVGEYPIELFNNNENGWNDFNTLMKRAEMKVYNDEDKPKRTPYKGQRKTVSNFLKNNTVFEILLGQQKTRDNKKIRDSFIIRTRYMIGDRNLGEYIVGRHQN